MAHLHHDNKRYYCSYSGEYRMLPSIDEQPSEPSHSSSHSNPPSSERQGSTRSCPSSIPFSSARSYSPPTRYSLRDTKPSSNEVATEFRPPVCASERSNKSDVIMREDNEGSETSTPVAPPRPSRLSRVMASIDHSHQQQSDNAHNAHNKPTETNDLNNLSKIRQRQAPTRMSIQTPLSVMSNFTQNTIDRVDVALNKHYYTIAYSIVLAAYFISFVEYLSFRLISILDPGPNVNASTKKNPNRQGKEGFHYGVSLGAFIVIGMFQLLCFFGLTISDNWTHCIRDPSKPELSQQRKELGDFIKLMLSKTMYRVFLCYGICAVINCLIILYMVGIRDSLGDVLSNVLCYIFDAVVILYFIAFPLTTIIYHPHVHCCRRSDPKPIIFECGDPRSQSSTLDTVVSHIDLPPPAPVQHLPIDKRKESWQEQSNTQGAAAITFSRSDPMRRHFEQNRQTEFITQPQYSMGQRQFDVNVPVLEQYLQSPRRPMPKSTIV